MKNIFATYVNPEMAEKAAGALLDHGVRPEHISIVFPESFRSTKQNYVKGDTKPEHDAKNGITTTTMGDATAGSAKGAGVGLAAGAIWGLASVFVPGVGLVIGGGALAIAIAGAVAATAAGAVAGGVTGYLMDQGVPANAVEVYHKVLTSGGALLTVSPTTEKIDNSQIEMILLKYEGVVESHPVAPAVVGMVSEGSPVHV